MLFDGDTSDVLGADSKSARRRATTPAKPVPLPGVVTHTVRCCVPGSGHRPEPVTLLGTQTSERSCLDVT